MALMNPESRKPLTPLLIGLLLILLPLLAVLQYRWLTEVSQGEEVQMKAHLHTAAEQFTGSFDRELTRAFLIFQPAPGSMHHGRGDGLAAATAHAWQLWQSTAPNPELVRHVDLVQTDATGQLKLLQFDPQQGRFVPVAWSGELSAWRDRLLAAWQAAGQRPPLAAMLSASDPAAVPAIPLRFGGGPMPPLERMGMKREERRPHDPPSRPSPQQVLLLELNAPWLRQTFLPGLAEHAFAPTGERDYHVSIRDVSAPARLLFDWGPSPDKTFAATRPDLSAPMFRIRMADFVAVWARQPPPQTAGARQNRTTTFRLPFPRPPRTIRYFERRPPGPEHRFQFFLPETSHPGLWELQVRHRAGSLAAAVGRIRRRNLAVSGGILLLLLASIALLFRLMRGAQRLAEQQMEFVAGVSHELRTPLAVIGSAASNLADGVVSEAGQVRRYGDLIANEGRRLNGMVEQILEFSALQVRRQPLQTQPVAVAPLLTTVIHSAEPGLTEKGMRLECQLPAALPEVEADPSALRRCVENLIGNAAKYAAEGGWIGIRTEVEGEELTITVADRGPGIEARDLPHLFEPFYRGRLALEQQIHGNGLGLSLVQRLMRAQGGRVTLRTQAGQGSSFTLHLRLAAPPHPASAKVPSQA